MKDEGFVPNLVPKFGETPKWMTVSYNLITSSSFCCKALNFGNVGCEYKLSEEAYLGRTHVSPSQFK